MKFAAHCLLALVLLSACGPPDDKVRTAEDAERLASTRCQKSSAVGGWHAERNGDTWIARFGEADAQGNWRLSARIRAADGNLICDVTLPWTKSG